MSKKKCTHCGYTFKPKGESETVCELCRIQMRDDSSGHKLEFDVTHLGSLEISGRLLLSPEKVVFEPKEEYAEKIEIAVPKIRDVRFATEKDISALRVFLLGAALGVLFKRKHKMLTIDYEDELGIIQHPVFEGNDMEMAIEELNEIRRTEKMGAVKSEEPVIKRELKDGNWQCSKCFRINSSKANFCTRCGEAKA